MRLRDIDFGPVWGASGVQGFFGEGYAYHKTLGPALSFDGMTFAAKTTTFAPRVGNMPMKSDGITPREFKPKCIKAYPLKGVALNAVGLSGPGAEQLLKDRRLYERHTPFLLSFMSTAATRVERMQELSDYVALLATYRNLFSAPFGLKLNYSCPNTEHTPADLGAEIWDALNIVRPLQVPILVKVNALFPIALILELEKHDALDGLRTSNTIHWKELPSAAIDRVRLFGTDVSPLEKFGGGGLSGAPLLRLVIDQIYRLRRAGFKKPINGGGGILCFDDAKVLRDTGADAVSLGSIAFLRPWRVQGIIQRFNAETAKRRTR